MSFLGELLDEIKSRIDNVGSVEKGRYRRIRDTDLPLIVINPSKGEYEVQDSSVSQFVDDFVDIAIITNGNDRDNSSFNKSEELRQKIEEILNKNLNIILKNKRLMFFNYLGYEYKPSYEGDELILYCILKFQSRRLLKI